MFDQSVSAFSSVDPSILVNVISDDTTALLAGLGGAVLGALVSALFSWLLHRASIRREIDKEKRQSVSSEKAVALSALVRLQSLINVAIDLRSHVIDCLAEASNAGHSDLQAWQKITPIAGFTQIAPSFSVEEISLLLSAKEPKVANELIRFRSRIESLLEAMREYNRIKRELKDLMPPTVMQGRMGLSSFTPAGYARIAPTVLECQDLIFQILTALAEDCPNGIEISRATTAALNSYFGDTSYRIDFNPAHERDVAILSREIERGKGDVNHAFRRNDLDWPSEYLPQKVNWQQVSD